MTERGEIQVPHDPNGNHAPASPDEATAAVPLAEAMYDSMVRYLVDHGWTRQEEVSGWWWKEGSEDCTIGGAVEWQLSHDDIDPRVMRDWEPRVFWPTEDEGGDLP